MRLNAITIFKICRLSLCIAVAVLILDPSRAGAERKHLVYFSNTVYELNVYKIYGKKPGKTLMLIGGIQGNEPGGFLSADLYADMRLEKGNLIVVPRANFYSIILNKRGPNGDMNRKFTHEDYSKSTEDKIVNILKRLISGSDYLLNLHDGAGYYHPKYINKWRNPTRFGQSIIADCDVYPIPGDDRVLELGKIARSVISEINQLITNELYKFHFMNTRTFDKESVHREQRKSATYYAVVKHHIPAFGVETSKFLPSIDLKVRYHNLIINTFMKHFDIIPESPSLILDSPILKYLVVSINGETPIVIKKNAPIYLNAGDSINVSHIEANYERGLSLDILGYGSLNDYRKDFPLFRDTALIVRKDNHKFAEIPIKVSKKSSLIGNREPPSDKIDGFVIQTRGHKLMLSSDETLQVVRGDKIKILDIFPKMPPSSDVKVNFKGFVGDRNNNTGEDRGFSIDTGTDLLKRYSLLNKGHHYEIIATRENQVLGKMIIALNPPEMDFMVLKVNGQKQIVVRPKDRISLSLTDDISIEKIHTNLYSANDVHLSINGHSLKQGEIKSLRELYPSSKSNHAPVEIKKGHLLLDKIFIDMRGTP